jgi:GT2 family glycosyltransferase
VRGEYLLYLNNDTEVEPGFLEPLVRCLRTRPNAGMASPKLRYFEGDRLVQYAGSSDINPYTGRSFFVGTGQPDDGRFDHTAPTAFIHGAAMLVSRAVLDRIGPMDDRFFLYYEEFDWCARARRAGFGIWYVGESVVYHKESVSTGRHSPLKWYYLTRNRVLFMRRNAPPLPRLVFLTFFSLIATPKHTLSLLLSRRFAELRAYWRGIRWNLAHAAVDNGELTVES